MFLIVHKEKLMTLGFFTTEEEAVKYIGSSNTVGIVYLDKLTLKNIKDAVIKKEEQEITIQENKLSTLHSINKFFLNIKFFGLGNKLYNK